MIKDYFPALSEKEKQQLYITISDKFELFNSFVVSQLKQHPNKNHDELIQLMYNSQLASKTLLLQESIKVRNAISYSDDDILQNIYAEWKKKKELLMTEYRFSKKELEERNINVAELEIKINNLEKQLSSKSSAFEANKSQTELNWQSVQGSLKNGETIIESVYIPYVENREYNNSFYLFLIMNNKSQTPAYVLVDNGDKLNSEWHETYSNSILRMRSDTMPYDRYWKPLAQATKKAKKIYFVADGVYRQMNLNTLLNPNTKKYIIENTNLQMISSSKALFYRSKEQETVTNNTIELFGAPEFASSNAYNTEETTRSTGLPRFGFDYLSPLPGTKEEVNKIIAVASINEKGVTLVILKKMVFLLPTKLLV